MAFIIFSHQSSPLLSHNKLLWPSINRAPLNHKIPILPRRIHTMSRRWDSNAETFRTQNFDFNDFEDEDDDSDGWLEDFIDGVWIFKVFRSFGWMLPAIISSLLLTSGPKAFLMALAIPLSQSVLSFAFQTVWGRPRNKTKRRGKSKRRRPRPSSNDDQQTVDAEEEEEEEGKRYTRKTYQTWVAGDGDVKTSSSFGGWEQLDLDGRKPKKNLKSKLSRREKRSDTPLLLRLLIAVFPFLGSWTRLL